MKQRFTSQRKANRGPHKVHSGMGGMPVWYRRKNFSLGADHREFDAKHGLIFGAANSNPVVIRGLTVPRRA